MNPDILEENSLEKSLIEYQEDCKELAGEQDA